MAVIEESDNIVTLHPAALDRYRADFDRLAALLPRPDIGVGSKLEESIRKLVSGEIVHALASSEKLEIEILGPARRTAREPDVHGTFWRGD
jgi:hypothetical protein